MTPSVQRALLVIADIGGYTRFLREQRTAMAHAQVVVSMLLEAVIDAAEGLELAKLEGDAAFFRSSGEPDVQTGRLLQLVAVAHRRFTEVRSELAARNTCDCGACSHIGALRLKFVAHVGEVVLQRVRRSLEVAGVDVILVHRMLKNTVPLEDYVLVTEPVLERLGPGGAAAVRIEHDFEGIGPTPIAYLPVPRTAEVAPRVTMSGKLLGRVMLEILAVPHRLGWRRPGHVGS